MKIILVIIIVMCNLHTMAQVKVDNDSIIYQYKFTIKDITNRNSSELVKEPLYDLFKTTPTYVETMNTFIFESREDILEHECAKLIPNWEITYFRKLTISKK